MSQDFETMREAIAALCRRYGVRRLDVFGSAIRGDFDPQGSDIDLAIEFDSPEGGLDRYFAFKAQMECLLKREVDLVELEAMANTRLKRIIQRSKIPLYAAQG
ncbi:MAG: nucleotidyltransferase domain-containing protein [Pseudomonadota bacterium]